MEKGFKFKVLLSHNYLTLFWLIYHHDPQDWDFYPPNSSNENTEKSAAAQDVFSKNSKGSQSFTNSSKLIFIQVVGLWDGQASVLQGLHFNFFCLLFGLLLHPLLLQNLLDGHLLQEGVTRLVQVLQGQQPSQCLQKCSEDQMSADI